MKKIFSVILIVSMVLSICSFDVFAENTDGTFKVVKSASADENGMWFNMASGAAATAGAEFLGNTQFDEEGNPNYDVFLKSAEDLYFGDVMQFDIMKSTSSKIYRFPFNLKNGDSFGNETVTGLSEKYLYISYYLKTVPDINNAKKDAYISTKLAIRDTSTKKDVTATPSVWNTTEYAYGESWQKVEATHDVATATLGDYTIPDSYNTYGGTPFIRLAFGDSTGTYSLQIADLNVVMFDSADTYQSVKDISALKALSFNGETLDVAELNYNVKVTADTSVADLKNMLSYTPYIDCNRVDVTYPASLPGTVEITSYALSADVTDTAETNKSVYQIYVDKETPSGYISLDVDSNGTATLKINKTDSTGYVSKVIIAGYNGNKLISCKVFDVNIAADAENKEYSQTYTYTVNNAAKYKAFCFESLANPKPLIKAAEIMAE